jgi:hypothetical protein
MNDGMNDLHIHKNIAFILLLTIVSSTNKRLSKTILFYYLFYLQDKYLIDNNFLVFRKVLVLSDISSSQILYLSSIFINKTSNESKAS